MPQFIRLDNHIIRRRADGIADLEDVGLFALLSFYLSIPDFHTPSGGLHAAVAKHCSNGRHTRNTAWSHLAHAGYLKRTRLPDENGCLKDIYTLKVTPDPASPAVNHLSFADGRRAWSQRAAFTPPTDNFTPVSVAALMDARLSLAAKGLYALIRQRMLLSSRVQGIALNREGLRRSSGLGECAFRRIWRELRDAGYLSLTHAWDADKKQMVYHYALAEQTELPQSPEAEATQTIQTAEPTDPFDAEDRSLDARQSVLPSSMQTTLHSSIQRSQSVSKQEPHAGALASPSLPEDVGDLVREQIEYDVLLTRDNPPPLLDCAVEVISRVLCLSPQDTLTIRGARYPAATVQRCLGALDANEAEFAVQSVRDAVDRAAKKGTPIRNLRAYLLCCLFTAKTDFAASLVY